MSWIGKSRSSITWLPVRNASPAGSWVERHRILGARNHRAAASHRACSARHQLEPAGQQPAAARRAAQASTAREVTERMGGVYSVLRLACAPH